jgi:DNA repair protein RecO (recombination protein O)
VPAEELRPCLVLRVQDYGEADAVIVFLHPVRGRIDAVARSLRKSRRRFPGLETFAEVAAVLQSGRGRLPTVRDAAALDLPLADAPAYPALCLASYAVENALHAAQLDHADPDLYAWTRGAIAASCDASLGVIARRKLAFDVTLLAALGNLPDLTHCARCGRSTAHGARWPDPEGGLLCHACAAPANIDGATLRVLALCAADPVPNAALADSLPEGPSLAAFSTQIERLHHRAVPAQTRRAEALLLDLLRAP